MPHFKEPFKQEFVDWYERFERENYKISHTDARDRFWDKMDLPEERKPARSTIYRWVNKYGSDGKKSEDNSEGKNMAEDTKTKGKEAIDQQVISSDVSKTGGESSGKKYTGGDDGNEKSKEGRKKQKKESKSSSTSQSLDLSNLAEWIKDHKVQIGLAAAGITVVVLVSRFKPTVSTDQLEGHGEGGNGDSGSSSNDKPFDDGEAWTGE